MPFGETRIGAFDQYLQRNGIPISGVSQTGDAPSGVTIGFQAAATQQQRDWAESAKQTFDWRPRQPLDRNTIVSQLSSRTAEQRDAIFAHVISVVLRDNSSEADEISAILGVPIPVDEVVPT